MAYTTINKSSANFITKRYSGNGSTGHAITTGTFQPDWSLLKVIESGSSGDWELYDALRGATNRIYPNSSAKQDTQAQGLQSFTSTGFTVGTNNAVNANNQAYISYNFKANGAGSTNTDGSVSATVSANPTAGFSIVKYTNPSSGTPFTLGHGLGKPPTFILAKQYDPSDSANNWGLWHQSLGFGKYLILNSSSAEATANLVTATSNTTFSTYHDHFTNNKEMIAYCWTDIQGYSKFNNYIGNGSATDGSFIYTGFAPQWVVIKTLADDNFIVFSNQISENNPSAGSAIEEFNIHRRFNELNGTGAIVDSGASQGIDMLSNGFKIYESNSNLNGSGQEYIYWSFGQSIVGSNNVPATAR